MISAIWMVHAKENTSAVVHQTRCAMISTLAPKTPVTQNTKDATIQLLTAFPV